jgi:hypothetical protein
MDLTSHIKFVEQMFSMSTEGPTGGLCWMFFGRPIPRAKWKLSINFWFSVIREVEKSIKQSIKQILQAWLGTHFFELLVDIFLWVVEALTGADIECEIETSRDPPSIPIFIPIPKIESSNGCARSDLPIRSLIF